MGAVAVLYGPLSKKYSFPAPHPLESRRVARFIELLEGSDLMEERRISMVEPVMATEELILSFHSREYIEFVKKASHLGFGYLDQGDTPAFKGIFEAASVVVGATVQGLEMVMRGEAGHAFNPVGGLHHARRDSASGFCVFNDAAVALVMAKEVYGLRRILYVDIDAHHGDGVCYDFYDDPAIYFADIHEDGRHLFPGSGFDYESGEGEARGRKLNIPLPPGSGDEEFREAFSKVEAFAKDAEPELILLQSGADGLSGDPLAHLNYSFEAHKLAADRLHGMAHEYCDGRLLALGGGGYDVENTARAWLEVVRALSS